MPIKLTATGVTSIKREENDQKSTECAEGLGGIEEMNSTFFILLTNVPIQYALMKSCLILKGYSVF